MGDVMTYICNGLYPVETQRSRSSTSDHTSSYPQSKNIMDFPFHVTPFLKKYIISDVHQWVFLNSGSGVTCFSGEKTYGFKSSLLH